MCLREPTSIFPILDTNQGTYGSPNPSLDCGYKGVFCFTPLDIENTHFSKIILFEVRSMKGIHMAVISSWISYGYNKIDLCVCNCK